MNTIILRTMVTLKLYKVAGKVGQECTDLNNDDPICSIAS